MKQSKTEKAVFAKLSTEKIELASASVDVVKRQSDDLKGKIGDYSRMLFDVNTALTKFRSEYVKAAKVYDSIYKDTRLLDSNIESMKDELKRLGLNESDVPAIKEALKVLQEAKEYDGILESDFGKNMK